MTARDLLPLVLALGVGISCASKGARAPAGQAAGQDVFAPIAGFDGGAGGGGGEPPEEASEAADDEDAGAAEEGAGPCARNMVPVPAGDRTFCVDMYEAALVEIAPDGEEKPHPSWLPVDGKVVRAVSEPGVLPQSYISELQAADACVASGKRLCTLDEWRAACRGPGRTTYPYGTARIPGACHDAGKSPVAVVFGAQIAAPPPGRSTAGGRPAPPGRATAGKAQPGKAQPGNARTKPAKGPASGAPPRQARAAGTAARPGRSVQTARIRKGYLPSRAPGPKQPARRSGPPANVNLDVWTRLNDPRLGQVEGGVGKTGDHPQCVNAYGVFDMMGNIHEWVATDASLPHGTFAGGYWLDTSQNGDGCDYKTQAHAREYHDYSTGFRCCSDAD